MRYLATCLVAFLIGFRSGLLNLSIGVGTVNMKQLDSERSSSKDVNLRWMASEISFVEFSKTLTDAQVEEICVGCD